MALGFFPARVLLLTTVTTMRVAETAAGSMMAGGMSAVFSPKYNREYTGPVSLARDRGNWFLNASH